MSIVTLQSIRKDFGIKEILRDASFSIEPDDKIGLIGVNGSGKSTVLKMIAGMESIDGGKRQVNSGATIVYLPQQPELDDELTVLDQVFNDSNEQMQLVRTYEDLSHQMSQVEGAELENLMAKLAGISAQMETTGAWELETKAKIILSKLGITDFEARVGDLSGGYRKRIALATALLSEPDLLLMDEPTNHLDAESVEWLQSYLKRYRGALLLITHDRYFLDQVTNRILEIDRGDLYTFSGNYSYYLEKKALAETATAKSQRKHQGILRRELEWLKRGPKARSTKQQARIDRIHNMQDQTFKEAQGKVDIDTPGRRIGKKVIELAQISKSYGDRTLIQDFSYEFSPEDRIGIIGGNGTGKSTLMNIMTGRVEPDAGQVEIGRTIHIGYFDQHSDDLVAASNQDQRVIDYVKEVGEFIQTADGSQISASQMLERFLFPGNQQYAPIHKLSGGEKRRLFLLRVLMSAPNVLILDEPTNDLDVQTLAVLEDYLENFNGCVVVVSHDRYFLDRTVDYIFALEDAQVRRYPGNYSIYLDIRQAEASKAELNQPAKVKEAEVTPEAPVNEPQDSARSRRLSNYERREFANLEDKIPELETKKAKLETTLYGSPPNDLSEVQQLSDQLATLEAEIETATERWMELAELES
ncbi:ABC-F family ATP-binding cassette domain-containing protein [Acaryochloris sp. 'Moss Beach']|uniref:ABC-F family ATP-binding cassette domain-containing protein n=1 Tax=Acaryochloris sp. 'Moss Beach' TaxID=2740837 RepID=UPI001F2F3572|nr:ABC-F family ATP-binding cassette domain-containing protein [Acaryochloris sp. 'Moss Beach']UJB69456.1 ABC-F family ATP-binding cassette domain-containing protein [Acaryochloris sp. 'Moss Beach']